MTFDPTALMQWAGVSTLAQTGRSLSAVGDILLYLGIIVGAAILLVVIGLVVRKKFQADDEPAIRTSFTLSDLRQMHQQGQLTDEEFDRAKKALIARSRAAYDADDGPEPEPTPPPEDTAGLDGDDADDDPDSDHHRGG